MAVVGVSLLASAFEGFRVEVRSFEVKDDGAVSFEIHGCSNSFFPISADRRHGTWRIVDVATGDTVADTSHAVYALVLVTETFGPRECVRALTESWDGHYWNQDGRPDDGTPVRGDRVRAGRYRLEASWGGLAAKHVEFEIAAAR